MTVATIEHIVIGDDAIARIAGTRMRVSQVAVEYTRHAWSAEAIHRQHPYLSLSQIHCAVSLGRVVFTYDEDFLAITSQWIARGEFFPV